MWAGSVPARELAEEAGRAVSSAIAAYRAGNPAPLHHEEAGLLLVGLTRTAPRSRAWQMMAPAQAAAHRALWADLEMLAPGQYRPAPAALLGFTALQTGDVQAAVEASARALEAQPRYTLAVLLRTAADAGLPPDACRPPGPGQDPVDTFRLAVDRHLSSDGPSPGGPGM